MDTQYIIALTWLAGFLLSRWMLRIEHKAEGREMTNGDEVNCVLLSLFSFAMVVYILVNAWAEKVRSYWKLPKNKKPE